MPVTEVMFGTHSESTLQSASTAQGTKQAGKNPPKRLQKQRPSQVSPPTRSANPGLQRRSTEPQSPPPPLSSGAQSHPGAQSHLLKQGLPRQVRRFSSRSSSVPTTPSGPL